MYVTVAWWVWWAVCYVTGYYRFITSYYMYIVMFVPYITLQYG
jgi:hypothetical protein